MGQLNHAQKTAVAENTNIAETETRHHWRDTKPSGRQTAQPGRTTSQAPKTLENMPKSEYLKNR